MEWLLGTLREVEHVEQHLVEPFPDDPSEFEFGLDLILDGLERIREAA